MSAHPGIDQRMVALARQAADLDQAVIALVEVGAELTEIDGFLMAPVRRHIERATEQLDELLYELENYGRGYVLRLSSRHRSGDLKPGQSERLAA
jgi:hypothetical protein